MRIKTPGTVLCKISIIKQWSAAEQTECLIPRARDMPDDPVHRIASGPGSTKALLMSHVCKVPFKNETADRKLKGQNIWIHDFSTFLLFLPGWMFRGQVNPCFDRDGVDDTDQRTQVSFGDMGHNPPIELENPIACGNTDAFACIRHE
jgi:hypothetical protein